MHVDYMYVTGTMQEIIAPWDVGDNNTANMPMVYTAVAKYNKKNGF